MLETSHDLILNLYLGIAPWARSWLRNMLLDILLLALILSLIIYKQRVTSSVLPLLTVETPLLVFLVLQLCLILRTLWIQGPVHVEQCVLQEAEFYRTGPSNWSYVQIRHKWVYSGTKTFLHSANLQATIQAAGFLQVPPKSSFEKLLLGTGLWQHAKMSATLKTPDGLNNAEC